MLTIHVWPKWLKEFLLTHSLYKSPEGAAAALSEHRTAGVRRWAGAASGDRVGKAPEEDVHPRRGDAEIKDVRLRNPLPPKAYSSYSKAKLRNSRPECSCGMVWNWRAREITFSMFFGRNPSAM